MATLIVLRTALDKEPVISMKPGTLFSVDTLHLYDVSHHVFMRMAKGYVDLTDGWNVDTTSDSLLGVRLSKGTCIELVQD